MCEQEGGDETEFGERERYYGEAGSVYGMKGAEPFQLHLGPEEESTDESV